MKILQDILCSIDETVAEVPFRWATNLHSVADQDPLSEVEIALVGSVLYQLERPTDLTRCTWQQTARLRAVSHRS